MITIGIDTGGTCTDAVVFDTEKHEVLSYGKTLTTKQDLKEGILTALKCLDRKLVDRAEYISLSTTLATNACVEGKGGRAKLVFIGVPPIAVEKMAGSYGLPPISEIYFLDGNAVIGDKAKEPDWEKFRGDIRRDFGEYDSIAVVQMNPKYNDGGFEDTAVTIITEELGVPCVKGYDLYQELNVQKRGATALLNAGLIPVMNSFFDSIDCSLSELGINLPIAVVKSDGSIMSKAYAVTRPVETLLCGPAASIIGAVELSGEKDAMIVDIGGTTSDVAMLEDGIPVTSEDGITIGSWNTMVKGVAIDTFALGGDSAVEYRDEEIYLDYRRIVPLCMAASKYPVMEKKLKTLMVGGAYYSYPANQFILLLNRPEHIEKFTPLEQKLIRALADGPLTYREAAEACGVSPYTFNFYRLEDEGVVIRSGVTPTDVMHIYGDYSDYNGEASRLGIEYLTIITKASFDEVCRKIYDMAKCRLYQNLTKIFMKHEMGCELTAEEHSTVDRITEFGYYRRDKGFKYMNPYFNSQINLIGIGAPTKIFLQDVAELFGVSADIPKYAKIANAVGAAVGTVICEHLVRIEPVTAKSNFGSFRVTGGHEPVCLYDYDEALIRAKAIAEERVREKALEEGAKTELKVEITVEEDFYTLSDRESGLFLETRIIARAMAK